MDRPPDEEENQNATPEDNAQDNAAQDDSTQDDSAQEELGQEEPGQQEPGQHGAEQDENDNPLAALDPTRKPIRRLVAIDEDLMDLGKATSELAHMMRKGDSEGIPALLAMNHLAVRALGEDVKDVRDYIRKRFG
jgi:hypothetical protein